MAKLYTVFGGSGFIGRYVVQALAKTGARVRVVARDPHLAAHLKPLAALGQLDIVRGDVRSAASVQRALDGADGAVNLVGILAEGGGRAFQQMHVEGARTVASAAAAAGVRALVHVSAIGADPESASAYGRSKGEGEAAVRAAFPDAAIFRPSVVFGPEDNFLNRFAGMMRLSPVVPVVAGSTRFQPVYVVDVARAIAAALVDPAAHRGKTYWLGGPTVFTMRELLQWIARTTGRTPVFVDVPDSIAGALAQLTGWMPGAPITADQWRMLQSDNVVPDGVPGLDALGIDPTPMAAVAANWLVRFRKSGRFGA